jgi:hypothetical protein
MKMFMVTLEGKGKQWYENLPFASLYSLQDFHTIFFEIIKDPIHHCYWFKTVVIILKFLFKTWRMLMNMMSSWMKK